MMNQGKALRSLRFLALIAIHFFSLVSQRTQRFRKERKEVLEIIIFLYTKVVLLLGFDFCLINLPLPREKISRSPHIGLQAQLQRNRLYGKDAGNGWLH